MIRSALLASTFLLPLPALAQQPVTVIGPVTPGNCPQFFSTTQIKDSGSVCSGGASIPYTSITGVPANTFLGNNTGSTANAIALTGTQATALLNQFTTSLQGVVPGSGGGTTNFLRADGTWAPPGSASGVSTITNSDGTLTFSPTSGNAIGSVNTAHAFMWTAAHTFTATGPQVVLAPTSGNNVVFESLANSGGTTRFGIDTNSGGTLLSGAAAFATVLMNTGAHPIQFGINGSLAASLVPAGTGFPLGTLNVVGNAQFGGGSPWADVTSGANGCPVAVGDNSTDNTSAIECQILYMYNTYVGGFVFFPPGNYRISSTLTVKGGVSLIGVGLNATAINTGTHDITAITFDSTVSYGGLRDMIVGCLQSTAATANCVSVGTNVPVIFRDAEIVGGSNALATSGVDGLYENLNLIGTGSSGGGVVSNGANWWIRDKIDNNGSMTSYGFFQGTYALGSGVAENHFVECDFSGNYSNSIQVNDGATNSAITVVQGGVMSAPVLINNGHVTIFNGAEFGGAIASNNNIIISGSYAFSGTSVTGSGTRSCSANINITC